METIKELPQVSESEWKVMEILWEESPLTSIEIVERLASSGWNPKTIKTLIHRLQKKGAISFEKDRRGYLYSPLYPKNLYVSKESDSILKKLFDGATAPMLTHFLKEKKLSKKDLQQIKELINELEEDQ